MTATTYSSKVRFRSLLVSMLRRNLATAIYLTLAMMFFFPLQYLLELMRQVERAAAVPQQTYTFGRLCGSAGNYTSLSIFAMTAILIASAIVLTVIQNNYMHSRRAVDLFHSLPVTRRQLMAASFLAVFFTIALPLIFCHLLVMIAGGVFAASGSIPGMIFYPGAMALDLAGWLVSIAVIIAVLMLVSALVGSPFENFVLGCELLLAGPVMAAMAVYLFQTYLAGYASTLTPDIIAMLSPVAFMPARYTDLAVGQAGGIYNFLILFWIAAGTGIFLLALWAYSRRKSEIADTSGARGPLGPVIRIIAVLIGASVIGRIFSAVNSDTDPAFVAGVFLGACLTAFLLEAVLQRGFKGMRRALPQISALVAGSTALGIVLVTGGLGYESRIPQLADIQTATLDFRGRYEYAIECMAGYQQARQNLDPDSSREHPLLYDYERLEHTCLSSPESLELVRQYHEALIRWNTSPDKDYAHYGRQTLNYDLNQGSLVRQYNRWGQDVLAALLDLESTQEFRQAANPVLRMAPGDVQSFWIADRYGAAHSGPQDNSKWIDALLAALQEDMRAEDYQRFNRGEAEIWGHIYWETGVSQWQGYTPLVKNTFISFSVPVLDSYRSTIQLLTEYGFGQLLEPPDTAQILSVEIESYSFGSGLWQGDFYQLPIWSPQASQLQSGAFFSEDQELIGKILAICQPYCVGQQEIDIPLYARIRGADGTGVEVVLPWQDTPQEIQNHFPYLVEMWAERE